VGQKILISAGEASGDLYAAALAEALRRRWPGLEMFGCAGPRMQAAGVRPVVDARSLSVVGLVEVVRHIPRIYGEYRKLLNAARAERPELAILTDSPDFHLRIARKLSKMGIPVLYFVAPQVWAWRKGRLPLIQRAVERLLCIFPFEPEFFLSHGIDATYIGHPLTRLIRPSASRAELRRRFGIPESASLVVLLPGSRTGEAARHLPILLETVQRLQSAARLQLRFILAVPPATLPMDSNLRERISAASIQVLEGKTWDALASADVALAASGTVTIEACLLGTPMVTFYRVNSLSWWMGKAMVRVPFFSMVNLVAQRRIVPELIQNRMTAENLTTEALSLLESETARAGMRRDLAEVAVRLSGPEDPLEVAAALVEERLAGKHQTNEEMVHVS
jgi:lipid-A-disaccharide synthase